MSLLISGDLRLAKDYTRPDDADAVAYIAAVEAADGQALETATRMAINSFVKGCKADGIWPAIKASCILAGARTLNGALVPLVGAAPTRFGTEGGWGYNRKTGLQDNGTNNYLDSNRNNNADPQNSRHLYARLTEVQSAGGYRIVMGSGQDVGDSLLGYRWDNVNRLRYIASSSATASEELPLAASGFGVSRPNSSQMSLRRNGANNSVANGSATRLNRTIQVFTATTINFYASTRLAFYSIGESLDLALLDARVTDLINAFGAAIP